jgi:hypothetical protein
MAKIKDNKKNIKDARGNVVAKPGKPKKVKDYKKPTLGAKKTTRGSKGFM